MDLPSPTFNKSKGSSGFQHSPFNSPPSYESPSPDFIPFSNSSPMKRGGGRGISGTGGPRRFFNRSPNQSFNRSPNQSFNRSSNQSFNRSMGSPNYSPYKGPFRRGNHNNGNFRGGYSNSPSQAPLHMYYNRSMVEDPWAELESRLEWDNIKEEVTATAEIPPKTVSLQQLDMAA